MAQNSLQDIYTNMESKIVLVSPLSTRIKKTAEPIENA
jgi:hypothetical protein